MHFSLSDITKDYLTHSSFSNYDQYIVQCRINANIENKAVGAVLEIIKEYLDSLPKVVAAEATYQALHDKHILPYILNHQRLTAELKELNKPLETEEIRNLKNALDALTREIQDDRSHFREMANQGADSAEAAEAAYQALHNEHILPKIRKQHRLTAELKALNHPKKDRIRDLHNKLFHLADTIKNYKSHLREIANKSVGIDPETASVMHWYRHLQGSVIIAPLNISICEDMLVKIMKGAPERFSSSMVRQRIISACETARAAATHSDDGAHGAGASSSIFDTDPLIREKEAASIGAGGAGPSAPYAPRVPDIVTEDTDPEAATTEEPITLASLSRTNTVRAAPILTAAMPPASTETPAAFYGAHRGGVAPAPDSATGLNLSHLPLVPTHPIGVSTLGGQSSAMDAGDPEFAPT